MTQAAKLHSHYNLFNCPLYVTVKGEGIYTLSSSAEPCPIHPPNENLCNLQFLVTSMGF